jgi:hypothetical protein
MSTMLAVPRLWVLDGQAAVVSCGGGPMLMAAMPLWLLRCCCVQYQGWQ